MRKILSYLLFLLFIALFTGCEQIIKKKGLISKEKFATLLMDFSIAEASYSRLIEVDSASMQTIVKRNANSLKKNNVTRKQFLDTYDYYNHNKKEMLEVYDLSLEMLMKKTDSIRSSADSIITAF